jgi:sirohydrochlorin ferrochelatase
LARLGRTAWSTWCYHEGPVAQLVSAPPCHGGGRGFESRRGRIKRFRSAQSTDSGPSAPSIEASPPPVPRAPTLLIAAHGTASAAGHRTLISLVRNVRALRPGLPIEMGFVDVLLPWLSDVLEALDGPIVLVPALLSRGYHVTADIPKSVRKRGGAIVARHLGPDPLITTALVDGLAAARGSAAASGPVALVSAGSSDPVAMSELATAAADLSDRLGVPVHPTSLSGADLDLTGLEVAPYLLAEGRMSDTVVSRATAAKVVATPIGAHPAIAALVLQRYDEALAE